MADVTLSHIDKFYGKQQALSNVSLTIKDGEFAVFVGPSGCGKSTLLRTIAGLESINSGSVAIDGRDVTHIAPSQAGTTLRRSAPTGCDRPGYCQKTEGISVRRTLIKP